MLVGSLSGREHATNCTVMGPLPTEPAAIAAQFGYVTRMSTTR